MKWSVERSVAAGFALALLSLIAVGVVSYQSTLNVEDAAAWRAHSNEVRLAVQSLLSSLQDAETGQRGFIITGDETYLQPYNTAIAVVGTQLANLRALTADNPTQQQLLNSLDPLVAAKLAELQQTIAVRRAQGFAAAQAQVAAGQGRQSMDQIRQVLASMSAEEDRLLAARDATLQQELLTTRWVVAGGSLLGVLVALLALGLAWRQRRNGRRAEAALAAQAQALASERDLLQVLMDYIPDTIYFKDRQSRFTRINRAQAKVLGVAEPAAALGKTDFDFQREDVSRLSFAREQEIMASGQPLIDWIESVPTPAGAPRWFSSTKVPIRDAAGQVTGLVGLSRDVTEHQLTQAALEARVRERTLSLRMLSECNQALVRAADETSLLDDICRLIVEIGGHRLAWVGLAEHDEARTVRPVAQAGDDEAFLPTLRLTWADDPQRVSPSGTAIRTGQVVVTHDIASDATFAAWQAQARRLGLASAISLPLIREAEVLGALSLYSASPDAFRAEDEVALLEELARDVAYGLAALRTQSALRRTERMLSETSRMALVGGWELDLNTQTLRWSDEMYRLREADPASQPGVPEAINFFAPEARPVITQAMERATADGTPWDLELPFITARGQRRWMRTQGQAERAAGRSLRLWGADQDITERKQAEHQLQANAIRDEALARLSKDLAEVGTNYREALGAVVRLLAERVGDGCALYLVSDDGQWLLPAAMHHRDPGAAPALQALKAVSPSRADEGLGGRVLQTGQSLLLPQVDPALLRANLPPEYSGYLDRYAIDSLLCVALRAEGRPLGTIVMSRSTPDRAYTVDDQSSRKRWPGGRRWSSPMPGCMPTWSSAWPSAPPRWRPPTRSWRPSRTPCRTTCAPRCGPSTASARSCWKTMPAS